MPLNVKLMYIYILYTCIYTYLYIYIYIDIYTINIRAHIRTQCTIVYTHAHMSARNDCCFMVRFAWFSTKSEGGCWHNKMYVYTITYIFCICRMYALALDVCACDIPRVLRN